MILLGVLAWLYLPTLQGASLRAHLSENLHLKCDTLPYRSTFTEDGCYFAVLRKLATKPREALFKSMMIDKSDFHLESDSSGTKFIMCSYDSEEKCDVDQATLLSGRCLVRAPKKMNFVDAERYCKERGMDIPAPTNDMDNRIARDVLVKDSVWINSNLDNVSKLAQVNNFWRWSTCDKNNIYAGSQKTCAKDMKAVVDGDGYWSKSNMRNPMGVICTKNAVNDFTKVAVAGANCDYHKSGGELKSFSAASVGFGLGRTCYSANLSSTRYDILGKTTVETRRGCEVACDGQSQCVAFSFKDAGMSSSCVLLAKATDTESCDPPTTIFLKTRTGCVDRTNFTAELGEDPCADEIVPSAFRGLGVGRPCPPGKERLYIMRAVDENGRRVTLHNDYNALVRKSGDMWEWVYKHHKGDYVTQKVVAFSCALAGGQKCPCKEPLKHLAYPNSYPGIPERNPACTGRNAQLWYDVVGGSFRFWFTPWDTAKSFVTCKAGMWIIWSQETYDSWGVTGISCWKP